MYVVGIFFVRIPAILQSSAKLWSSPAKVIMNLFYAIIVSTLSDAKIEEARAPLAPDDTLRGT